MPLDGVVVFFGTSSDTYRSRGEQLGQQASGSFEKNSSCSEALIHVKQSINATEQRSVARLLSLRTAPPLIVPVLATSEVVRRFDPRPARWCDMVTLDWSAGTPLRLLIESWRGSQRTGVE